MYIFINREMGSRAGLTVELLIKSILHIFMIQSLLRTSSLTGGAESKNELNIPVFSSLVLNSR